ncbi:MAG: Unknown protein [uncultured Thiotrichaceae bacterium]|uniref:Uncharacterized protein n=1 Tax=uncultured Thiotrichaceae bacterium TaxID=298394 RepID=A0A6S6UA08_9GAMM|nr:MAG: Unknown protein [uncultured Thiotrichaceae bacterium]
MKQRLQHSRLEQAIQKNQSLAELLEMPCELLRNYCVRDYIGSPALKKDHSVDNTHAKGFFEDQGAWRKTLPLDIDAGLSLAVFATFFAVEMEAGTDQAEFLVLTPKRSPDQEGGMYVGLMRSHNTDELCQRLTDDPAVLKQMAAEVSALVEWLRMPVADQPSVSESWFERLFKGQSS